ncbi:ATP-binding protein [Candidatus Margulisiibacteriota bacterium]
MVKNSIFFKLVVIMISLLVAVITIFTVIQISLQLNILEQNLERRLAIMRENLLDEAYILSSHIGRQVKNDISVYSFFSIISNLNNEVKENKDLTYAVLMDKDRKAYVHTLSPGLQQVILTKTEDIFAQKQKKEITNEFTINKKPYLEYIVPIVFVNEIWGTLRLGFSLEAFNQEMFRSKKEIAKRIKYMIIASLAVAFLFILLGTIFVWIFSKKLTSPLIILTSIVKKFTAGDYEAAKEVDFKSKDEIGVLGMNFKVMTKEIKMSREKLEEANRTLEEKVQQRTINLRDKNKEISDILNAIDEGIFTINLDLSVNPEHSKKAEELFNRVEFKDKTLESILNLTNEKRAEFIEWLDILSKPERLKNWQKLAKLNPINEIVFNKGNEEKYLKLECMPIIENEKLHKLMILAQDVTHHKIIEKSLNKAKKENELQMQRILSLSSSDKSLLESFFEELNLLLNKYKAVKDEVEIEKIIQIIFREMHTLKGNASSFGFNELANKTNIVENFLSDLRRKKSSDITDFFQALKGIEDEYRKILELRNRLFMRSTLNLIVNKAYYQKYLLFLLSSPKLDIERIVYFTYYFNSTVFRDYCKKYEKIIERFRIIRGKNIDYLEIINPDIQVHRDIIKIVDPLIIHLIRNAIDHGIEADERRKELNKGKGKITLAYHEDQDKVRIIITDNGSGINLEEITKKAIEKKFISPEKIAKMTDKEKLQIIFLAGFSSTDIANNISGRGVGLDVVKTTAEEIGGGLNVKTKINEGTEFEIWLPKNIHFKKYLESLAVSIKTEAGKKEKIIKEIMLKYSKDYQKIFNKISIKSFLKGD